ncbi:MAG: DUF5615 family PIN-like protein [Candidatus Brocadiae bacterium]|nr:DUF5615 family PIN-like protein [Candidatus Brocadiia bacterium]
MTAFYGNENFPLQVIRALRVFGHDVLTSLEAGNANRGVPDADVLTFARVQKRVLLTLNRHDFRLLHAASPEHEGIVACTEDKDFERQARSIDARVKAETPLAGKFITVYRPAR